MSQRKILYIHQIYGLYDDNKPLTDNQLFVDSYMKYTFICDNNNRNEKRKYNYIYKLWNKESCEELLKRYPEFNYYYDVRFKIMKVDIMRFIILYHYGGIYSDMDVLPAYIYNLDFVLDCDKIHLCKYVNKDNNIYDIEVISTPDEKNELLYEYLKYIPSQIIEKNNIDVYKSWKIRYVYQTTGPRSFNRFLKMYGDCDNIKQLNTILFEKNIIPKNIPWDLVNQFFNITFFSFHSQTYKQDIYQGKTVCTHFINKKKN